MKKVHTLVVLQDNGNNYWAIYKYLQHEEAENEITQPESAMQR
jgi:hypothetical protein